MNQGIISIKYYSYQIRDFVNENNLFKRDFRNVLDKWNKLCVAMDTLEDSTEALDYFEKVGVGEEDGEKYLHLYGLLQAIFLQQDSIRNLYSIFLGIEMIPKKDSSWTKIRNLRNLTIGHPIEWSKAKKTKRCYISRITIQNKGFHLIIWNVNKLSDEYEEVDFINLYQNYKR